MKNLSDSVNFGELEIFWGSGRGAEEGGTGGGAPNGSLCPGRQKPSLRPWNVDVRKKQFCLLSV